MGFLRYSVFLFLLLILLLPNVYGSGFTFDGLGVKARGMGGAFRAIADDWSAAYYNPAGYNRIKDNYLAANLAIFHDRYWAKPNVYWNDIYETGFYNGQDVANNHEILNIPQGGIVFRLPVWGETVFGLSGLQLFDENHRWRLYNNLPGYGPADYPGTQFYNNLDVVAFQATAARGYMNDKLSIGVGLQLLRADMTYSDLALRQNGMPSPLSDRPYDKIPEVYYNNGNGWGFGYRAGLLYDISEKLSAALVYAGKSSIKIDGSSTMDFYLGDNQYLIENRNYFPNTQEYLFASGSVVRITADFKTTLDVPASVSGGLAYKLTGKLIVDADFEYTFWSQFKGFEFDYENYRGLKDTSFHYANDTLFTQNPSVPIDWDNAARFMIGAEYKALSFIDLRTGFGYDQSPVKAETFIPQFIDLGNKYSYSFGLGFTVGFWNMDMAMTYTHHPDLTVSGISDVNGDGIMDNLPGDYRANYYQTVLGISYRF